MNKPSGGLLAVTLVSLLPAGRCWATENLPHKPISEEALRMASARLYSDILRLECLHGRRYPRSQIESGFKRHFEEMRLLSVDDGHTIVADVAENPSQMAFDARQRLGDTHKFGCSRAYWLDE